MKNFDRYIGIDWSGAKGVYTPSIAVAEIARHDKNLHLIKNDKHKYWSRQDVFDWICTQAQSAQRALIGIDCNFGYCHAVGVQQFGTNYDYRDLWEAVNDASDEDNFYAGGFWSHENFTPYFWMNGKQPEWFNTARLQRQTEKVCIENGYGRPESPFKLFSAKQVGKGGMAGMRMALALKKKCGDAIAFWPFEKDIINSAPIVITEIFPRQFLRRFTFGHTKIRTVDQLKQVIKPYAGFDDTQTITDHDTDALISALGLKYLCGEGQTVPENVSNPPTMQTHHARCEGWIFGVGDT